MKLLENPKLEAISHKLSIQTADCSLTAKVESYSCKMITKDKKLFKHMNNESGLSPNDLQALSPPTSSLIGFSPTKLGSHSLDTGLILCDAISTKTLFFLNSTLNESFHPDYDFTHVKSDEFTLETDIPAMMNSVNCRLMAALGDEGEEVTKETWLAINQEISISECKVYSYSPEVIFDPYQDCLWYFNYFFFNKKLKRILFFSCSAKRLLSCGAADSGVDVDGEGEDQWSVESMEG